MPEIVDSYSESNGSATALLSGSFNHSIAQSFEGDGTSLVQATFSISRNASPTGNVVAKLYAITGAHGTDAKPTGAPLAVSDAIDASTIPTSAALVDFQFTGANRVVLQDATRYAIALEFTGGDATNRLGAVVDNTSPTHAGNYSFTQDGTNWSTSSSLDAVFYVYGVPTADDARPTELHGTASANAARDSVLTGASAPALNAEQDGNAIRLQWTHDPNP